MMENIHRKRQRREPSEDFEEGDLKPHLIEYIPDGDYILREEMTPYGFLQSVDLPFFRYRFQSNSETGNEG